MFRQFKKTAFTLLVLTLGLTIVFTGFMVLAFLLPDEKIEGNVEKSLKILESEAKHQYVNNGNKNVEESLEPYPALFPYLINISQSKNINYYRSQTPADAFGLLVAGGKSIFYNAMYTEFIRDFNLNHADYANGDPSSVLWKAMVPSYARFWAGYTTVLRPLLIFGDITLIRAFNFSALLLCFFILCFMMSKRFNSGVTIIFTLAFAVVQAYMVPFTISYISTFLLTLIASIIMLKEYEQIKQKQWLIYFFFILGAINTFWDIGISAPLLSLLIPLTFYFLLRLQEDGITPTGNLKDMFKSVFSWGLGYILLWVAKWVVASMVFKKNVLSNVYASFLERTGSEVYGLSINRFDAIIKNLNYLSSNFLLLASIIMAILIILIAYNVFKRKKNARFFFNALPLLAIAIAPVMWLYLIANLAVSDTFMTYRILAASIFAMGCQLLYLYKGIKSVNVNKLNDKCDS